MKKATKAYVIIKRETWYDEEVMDDDYIFTDVDYFFDENEAEKEVQKLNDSVCHNEDIHTSYSKKGIFIK